MIINTRTVAPARRSGMKSFHRAATSTRSHVGINIRAGLGLLHAHRVEIDFRLFRQKHGEPGLDSLPHFRLGDDQRDMPVRIDVHVGVEGIGRGFLRARIGFLRMQQRFREAHANDQGARSGDGPSYDELPAADVHGHAPFSALAR